MLLVVYAAGRVVLACRMHLNLLAFAIRQIVFKVTLNQHAVTA